jgi:hypothetical protein
MIALERADSRRPNNIPKPPASMRNLRQIDDQHPAVPLAEYSVPQYRTGVSGHNSAIAPDNTGVSQILNGYLQHHHLLQSFPEILVSEFHPASTTRNSPLPI